MKGPTKRQAERVEAAADRLDNIRERFEAVGIDIRGGGLMLSFEEAEEILYRLEDGRTIRRFGWRPTG